MKWRVGKSAPGAQECNQAEIPSLFRQVLTQNPPIMRLVGLTEKCSHVLDEEAHLSEHSINTFPLWREVEHEIFFTYIYIYSIYMSMFYFYISWIILEHISKDLCILSDNMEKNKSLCV